MSFCLRPKLALVMCVSALFLSSCSSTKSVNSFRLGEKVKVGKLYYQVLEAQWLSDLPGSSTPPKNRILKLHVTMSNSGGSEIAVPLLRLIDASERETMEVANIENDPQWLGSLRRLQPAILEEGMVYFDVPVGAYKLELVDNSDAENEQMAYVDIPASLAPPVASPASPTQ